MLSIPIVIRRYRAAGRGAVWLSSLRGRDTRTLVANASSLMGTVAVSSVLGFAYWWVAARQFAPNAVGIAAAEISAMLLLGNLAVLGLGYLLIAELPRQQGREATLIATALAVAGGVGALFGVVFAFVAPLFLPDLGQLGTSAPTVALIALGVGVTAIGRVLDQAVLGLLQGALQLWRNLAFAVVKLIALVVVGFTVGDHLGLAIYATWVAGELVSLVGLAALAYRRGGNARAFRPQWRLLGHWGRAALGHHAINIALQTPAYTLPLVVTALLSATANSYFYAAWLVANVLFVGPFALCTALFAVASRAPMDLGKRTWLTLGLSFGGGLAANVVLVLAASPILGLFHPEYAEQAATTLRILTVGVFPLIVKEHYVAICRVREQPTRTAPRLMMGGCLEILCPAIGAWFGGLNGLSAGWLAALTVEAVLMAPRVYRTVTRADPSDEQSDARVERQTDDALPVAEHRTTPSADEARVASAPGSGRCRGDIWGADA
jgi:O-antigen/teichoic acid export membrane protein